MGRNANKRWPDGPVGNKKAGRGPGGHILPTSVRLVLT
jgi:hypothetical protein